jgi:hypothetical protein
MCYSCRPIPDLETNGYKKRVNILTGLGSNFVAMRIFTDKTLNWSCKYHEIVLGRKQNMKYSTYILNHITQGPWQNTPRKIWVDQVKFSSLIRQDLCSVLRGNCYGL